MMKVELIWNWAFNSTATFTQLNYAFFPTHPPFGNFGLSAWCSTSTAFWWISSPKGRWDVHLAYFFSPCWVELQTMSWILGCLWCTRIHCWSPFPSLIASFAQNWCWASCLFFFLGCHPLIDSSSTIEMHQSASYAICCIPYQMVEWSPMAYIILQHIPVTMVCPQRLKWMDGYL